MMNCSWLGFWIFMSMVIFLSYHDFQNGGKSFFFKDLTEIEKDKREIQKLEVKQRLEKLRSNEKI